MGAHWSWWVSVGPLARTLLEYSRLVWQGLRTEILTAAVVAAVLAFAAAGVTTSLTLVGSLGGEL